MRHYIPIALMLFLCGCITHNGKTGELDGPCKPDGTCGYPALKCTTLTNGFGDYEFVCLAKEIQ